LVSQSFAVAIHRTTIPLVAAVQTAQRERAGVRESLSTTKFYRFIKR
jgi:hypothetical protein